MLVESNHLQGAERKATGAQEQEVAQEWEVSQESDRAGGGDQKGSSIVLSRNSHAWWPLIAYQVGSGGAFLRLVLNRDAQRLSFFQND